MMQCWWDMECVGDRTPRAQELQRERERNRDLVDVRYGSQPYGGDERRSCEAGNCCVQ